MKDNDVEFDFKYPKSKPASPFAHLMNIIPRVSMDLLPEKLKNQILSLKSDLKEHYPFDYDIDPIDRAWEYSWHPNISPLNMDKIDKFVEEFDWNCLDEYDIFRNHQGKVKTY